MDEMIFAEKKSVFNIVISKKATDKFILEVPVVAFSESEAIRKVKVGSVLQELGLTRNDVDFFIKITGNIYEGKTFSSVLSETPTLTASEVAAAHAPAQKAQAIIDNLPSWSHVSTAVDNIANLADAKAYLKKLSRVVYWLAKDSGK